MCVNFKNSLGRKFTGRNKKVLFWSFATIIVAYTFVTIANVLIYRTKENCRSSSLETEEWEPYKEACITLGFPVNEASASKIERSTIISDKDWNTSGASLDLELDEDPVNFKCCQHIGLCLKYLAFILLLFFPIASYVLYICRERKPKPEMDRVAHRETTEEIEMDDLSNVQSGTVAGRM